MELIVEKTSGGREYRVKDISKAEAGRMEIKLAEANIPGLMICRSDPDFSHTLFGVRISGCLHMTVQTAVLIETLTALGARVRWCSCNMSTTDDAAAAAVARDSASVFAWESNSNDSIKEYWWCILQCLDWGNSIGPDILLDQRGDAILLIHEGVEAEEQYEASGILLDENPTSREELRHMYAMINQCLQTEPERFRILKDSIRGAIEATDAAEQFLGMPLLFPIINATNSVISQSIRGRNDCCDFHIPPSPTWKWWCSTDSFSCKLSITEYLYKQRGIQIFGKLVFICGYGRRGKILAKLFRRAGGRIFVSEVDPLCAMQAHLEGFPICTLEDIISEADIFITTTGETNVIKVNDMSKMKDHAVVCNFGRSQEEIDTAGLASYPGIQRISVYSQPLPESPQIDDWVFPSGKKITVLFAGGNFGNLGCGTTSHQSLVMSFFFTNQVLAAIELWTERGNGKKYRKKVHAFPPHLERRMATMHLNFTQRKLTRLMPAQALPFKKTRYMY